jgi:hypothetical protein
MLSKARGTPVYSPAPGVIPDMVTWPVSSGSPVELAADRDAEAARDLIDAGRWLDEGGSFDPEPGSR